VEDLKKNLDRIKELTEELTIIPYFNEEIMSIFLEDSPIISWIEDSDGRYVYANKACLTRFNITESILGKTDKDFFPLEVAETFRANDLMVLERNEKIELREDAPTPDGVMRKWFVIKFPMTLHKKSYVGGLAVDITNME